MSGGPSGTVTFLFTDIEGSTLAWQDHPAEMRDALAAHDELIRALVERHGGHVFSTGGDGFAVAFGGVTAALDAAAAIQRAIPAVTGDAGLELRVRVGLHSGEAVERGGDYFGPTVNRTARIMAIGHGGQVLVSAAVAALVSRPPAGAALEERGEHQLKDLAEPEPILELVLGERSDAFPPLRSVGPTAIGAVGTIPLPVRLSVAYPMGFVGRETERDVMRSAWKATVAGERRVVLVSGEAGLGKTRLSTEIAREAFDSGALVLYGRCEEDLTSPYRPWVEALGQYATFASDVDFAGHDARVLGELARLIPVLRDRAPSGDAVGALGGDGDRYVLLAAVTTFVAMLAAQRPVVIVLDDLHWADRASLQLLRHVVGQLSAAPLLIVGTYRDTDIGADDPLTATLADLRRETGVERLGLVGLSDTEILSLLEATAGHAMDAEGVQLAHALRNETSGNPFFVGELLLHLAESGVIAQRSDGRWVATVALGEAGLPQSVREVVGVRVRRLGERAQSVLGAAAIAGRDFDVAVVAGAVDLDDDTVLDILEPAMAAGLVSEVPGVHDRFTFTHALVQHTLYADLPASRRVRLHRKIAETIESLVGPDSSDRVAELATHWFAAIRPVEIDKAIGYAIKAGDQAIDSLAPDDAVRWYRQALDAIGDRDLHQRCDVAVRLGDAERQAGDPAYRSRLLDAARLAEQLEDRDLLVAAALANNRGYVSSVGQVDAERVAVLEAALATVGHDDSVEHARVLSTLAIELYYSGDRRSLDLGLESVEMARRLGNDDVILDTILKSSSAIQGPGEYAHLHSLAEEAMRRTDGLDDTRRFWALVRRGNSLLLQGDIAAVLTCVAERRELADRLGQPVLRWNALVHDAPIETILGNLDEAERLADEVLALGSETGQPDALLVYGALLMQIRVSQGREGELTDLIAQAAADNPGLPALGAALAFNLTSLGELDAARTVFDEIAKDDFTFPADDLWLVANCLMAQSAFGLDDRPAAELLMGRLKPYRELIAANASICVGGVSQFLGCLAVTLGQTREAEQYFNDAFTHHERLQAPFFLSRTMLELANVVRAREPERARTLVQDALTLAQTHGMASVRERALEALTGIGS